MLRDTLLALTMLAALAAPALADEPQPMNTQEVDPAMLKDFYGTWEIRDESGKKRCLVELKPETTIGGSEIGIDNLCAHVFPVMDEIAAWRLMEGWGISLVDGLRQTRIRFTTPDETYIAQPETDGIFTIEQKR